MPFILITFTVDSGISLQSTLFLSAHAEPDKKSESATDTKKLSADEKNADTVEKKAGADADVDNSKVEENSVPIAKMVYNKQII
jgi:hypothetical protein